MQYLNSVLFLVFPINFRTMHSQPCDSVTCGCEAIVLDTSCGFFSGTPYTKHYLSFGRQEDTLKTSTLVSMCQWRSGAADGVVRSPMGGTLTRPIFTARGYASAVYAIAVSVVITFNMEGARDG